MKKTLPFVFAISLAGFATASMAQDMNNAESQDERYKRMFNQLDTDGSSTIDKAEAEPAGLSAEDFDQLDRNADGELDIDEFLQVVPSDSQ